MLLAGSVPASAATEVGISDVKAAGTTVTGILTFRAPTVVEVDPSSLTAKVDGESVSATVQKSTHLKRTAMLVIDTSGSMSSAGMATVRSATRAYLKEVPDDVLVGVVTFADTAGVDLAPTTDRAAVQRVVNGLQAGGDTSLYAAVQVAVRALGNDGERSMVLLSDGADTMSQNRAADRAKVTSAVKQASVRVDVVRFNTNDPDASTALGGFAQASGGSVIAADNADTVGKAFQTAARALKSQALFHLTTDAPLSGTHTLQLVGTAGGESFSAQQTVDFGAAAARPTPTPQSTPAGSSGEMALPSFKAPKDQSSLPWVAAATLGLALFLLTFGVLTPTLQTRRERRVAAIEGYVIAPKRSSRSEGKTHATPISEQLVGLGERAMKGRKSTAKTMALIHRADLPLRAGEWFVLTIVALVIGIALGILLLNGSPLLGAIVGAIFGALLPQVVLRVLAARRAAAFERILPQALMLVATSLRSGFGLPQALDAVAKDSAEPVAKEFSRALAETRIGTDIADALDRIAERMGSRSMHLLVMAIRIQREVGGNLAETIETTAKTLRERESLYRQVRALSAEGRLSAYILIALPFALFFYMLWVNYDYISLLWTTLIGLLMVTVGLVLLVIGILWMRRVVKIEV